MKNDIQSIHEQYKRIITEGNEEPQYNNSMKTTLHFKSKSRYNLAKQVLNQSMMDNEFPSDCLSADDDKLALTISGKKWLIDSAISELAISQIWPRESFIGPAQFTIEEH